MSGVPADYVRGLLITDDAAGETHVLTVDGVLGSTTYRPLRDAIIESALGCPLAVIVDVSGLDVPTPSAWAVFTSAQWQIGQWPDVPVILVCDHERGIKEIAHSAVARYMEVYPSVGDATAAAERRPAPIVRRRARAELPRAAASPHLSRELMTDWLTAWSRPELIAVAKLVVTVFVENVLAHTQSPPSVRLECKGELVTISVEDGNSAAAIRKETSQRRLDDVSGLAIVAALCRAWGSLPTPSGKTVWASFGPENPLASE